MASFDEQFYGPETDLYQPQRPMPVDDFAQQLSSNEPEDVGAPLPNFTEFRRRAGDPTLKPERPEVTRLRQAYDAEKERVRQEKLAQTQAKEQARQEMARWRTDIKVQKESGVEMQTDPLTGVEVPKRTPTGEVVYNPGWTSEPRFDPAKSSWVRDFRDPTGAVATKDLWEQGDIKRDDKTADLYIEMPGGARQVVGKDQDFLKVKEIKQDIDNNARAFDEKQLAHSQLDVAFTPRKEEYNKQKKVFDDAAEAARETNMLAIKDPAYLKANETKIRDLNQQFETAKKAFLPLRQQKKDLDDSELSLKKARIEETRRKLELTASREAIEAAQRRPEFAAPSLPPAGEPPDVTAERKTNGIAGDAFHVPDINLEQKDLTKRIGDLDEQIKTIRGADPSAAPANVQQLEQVRGLEAQKREAINRFTARQAATVRWQAQDKSLDIQAQAIEGAVDKRKTNQPGNTMWAKALFRYDRFKAWQTENEQAILGGTARVKAIRDEQNNRKRATLAGLKEPSDFPASLMRTDEKGQVDLDPLAVQLRARGRATAFHGDERDETIRVLDEIAASGKAQLIGGRPIPEIRREMERQRAIMPEDMMTAAETQQIQKGLRGPLVSHQGELFRQPETQIAAPGQEDPEEQNRQFLQNLLFGAQQAERQVTPQMRMAKTAQKAPQVQADILAKRSEIQNRPLLAEIPNYQTLSPAERKTAIEGALRKRNEDLAKLGTEQAAMGPERAGFVQEIAGEKPTQPIEGDDYVAALRSPEFRKQIPERLESAGISLVAALSKGITSVMNTQAVFQSATSGPGGARFLLRSLLNTIAPSLGVPAQVHKIDPSEHPQHQAAEQINEALSKAQGEYRDSLINQLAAGVGSSLTFLPAAAMGGNLGVAVMGLAQGFGDSYYETKARAEAQGKPLSEMQLWVNGALGAGLNATEGIPLARGLERLEKMTGGAVRRVLNSVIQGGEEGGQELVQQGLQNLIYKLQGLEDRDWGELAKETAQGGGIAGLVGLLMGFGMNAADRAVKNHQAGKIIDTIKPLNATYNALSQAILSPEALAKFNQDYQAKPGFKPLTAETAQVMLTKVKEARNDALVQLLRVSPDTLENAAKNVLPRGDRAKLIENINPSVLSETAALGRDLQHHVVTDLEKWTNLRDRQAPLVKDVVAGQAVIQQIEGVARGGNIKAELGAALEEMGLLIRQPTPSGGTRWVATAPAVQLFSGPARTEMSANPEAFAVSTSATTTQTGAMGATLRQTGDQQIDRSLTPPPLPVTEQPAGQPTAAATTAPAPVAGVPAAAVAPAGAPAAPGAAPAAQPAAAAPAAAPLPGTPTTRQTYRVVVRSTDPKTGYAQTRAVSVLASTPEAAEQAAQAQVQANKWKGDWVPVEVSPTTGAAVPYTVEGETTPATPAPAPVPVGGHPLLGGVSGEPVVAGGGAAPGVAPAPEGGTTLRPEAAPGPGVEVAGPPGVVAPGPVPPGAPGPPAAPNSPDAQAWRGRAIEPKTMGRALARLGVQVTSNSKNPNFAQGRGDGSIVLNYTPSGEEMWDNATLNEELWHVTGLLTLRAEWEAAGRPGDFNQYEDARLAEMFDELATRIRSLEGVDRGRAEKALVDSFNLYFSEFHEGAGQLKVAALDDIEALLGQKTDLDIKINANAVLFEFARQLTQLRETNSISETAFARLARQVMEWLNDALKNLRGVAASLDAEGGAFEGTAFQAMVLEMEKEMRKLNDRMSRMLAADEEAQAAAEVDRYFTDPVVNALIEMGGVLSRSQAQKRWTKEKYEANKSQWEDAPKLRNPKHNKIYNPNSTISPDEATSYLIDQGLLPEGSTTSDMWTVVAGAAKSAARAKGQEYQARGLHNLALEAYKAGHDNDVATLERLIAAYPALRNDLEQQFGRGRRSDRQHLAKPRERREILAHAEHSMAIQKQARVVGEKGEVVADEEANITAGIEKALLKAGIPEAEHADLLTQYSEQALNDARAKRVEFPAKPSFEGDPGWKQPKVTGAHLEQTKTEDGKTATTMGRPTWANSPYSYQQVPEGQTRAEWVSTLAGRVANVTSDILARSKKNPRARGADVNDIKSAQTIMNQVGWYRNMIRRLRGEMGGFAEPMADFLGTFSPGTGVFVNFMFAMRALHGMSTGRWDDVMRDFDAHIRSGGTADSWKESGQPLITHLTGKKFGFNSEKGMLALLNLWRAVKAGEAPKARNFTRNLIGLSVAATIDRWAARHLDRMAGVPRAPTYAEGAVSGTVSVKTGKPGGQFGFGQEVFAEAAEVLRKRHPQEFGDITPADLQAMNWFAEKEVWGKYGWTSEEGEGGSFEAQLDAELVQRFLVGLSQEVVSREVPVSQWFVPRATEQEAFGNETRAAIMELPNVLAARAMDSFGMFHETVERALDVEVLTGHDFDPRKLIDIVARQAGQKNQKSTFISRVIDPQNTQEEPNARPGVEVYFTDEVDLEELRPAIDFLQSNGINGFTAIVDPRAQILGVEAAPNRFRGIRFQYVPEYSKDAKWVDKAQEIRQTLIQAARQLNGIKGVANAQVLKYDTVVLVQGIDYDGTGRIESGPGTGRADAWVGRFHGAATESADRINRVLGAGEASAGQVSDRGKAALKEGQQHRARPRVEETPELPAFYSRLERTIEAKMPERAPARQILGIIQGAGLKGEEIKWSGIGPALDRLAAKHEGKIPKAAVLDYLRNDGAVRLEEVNLSDKGAISDELKTWLIDMPTTPDEWIAESRNLEGLATRHQDSGNEEKADTFFAMADEANRMAEGLSGVGSTAGMPRFNRGDLILPGGENYREMVLTMPVKAAGGYTVAPDPNPETAPRSGNFVVLNPDGNVTERGFANVAAAQRVADSRNQGVGWKEAVPSTYTSSHFPDVPNYVAHMRASDRTDAEGKPGLFIEELQSDRHQQAREKGYALSKEEVAERLKAAPDSELNAIAEQMGGIPDAPFRKDWPLQLFKRALRDAVEQGKKWIGWTNGETQADRYDLSKQLNEIEAKKMTAANGTFYSIGAKDKNGQDVLDDIVAEDKLADTVGKELAAKISEQPMDEWKTYSGLDLKVGGEGMRGFYDQILPKEIGKYTKQWGAGVEKADIERSGPVFAIERQLENGQWHTTERDFTRVAAAEEVARRNALGRNIYRVKEESPTIPIWRVNITPEMEKGVKMGQPLFAKRRAPETTGDLFAQPERAAAPAEDKFVKPRRASGDVPVTVDIAKFDQAFAKEKDMYVGPGGTGQIGTRYQEFEKWMEQGLPIEMPEVSINSEGKPQFTNGRHRYAWLRDHGRRTIQLAVSADKAAEVQKRFGAEAPRTLETIGEDRLFTEGELPFNLQGEIDTTPERQAATDAARAETERQAAAEGAQQKFFAKPRVEAPETAAMPLSVAEGMAGATPEEARQFRANVGNAIRIADEFPMPDARDEAQIALAQAVRSDQPVEAAVRDHMRHLSRPIAEEAEPEAKTRAMAMAEEAEASATAIGRDIEEASVPAAKRAKIADIYNAHLRGRFDKMNYFAEGSGDLLQGAQMKAADWSAAMRIWKENLERKVSEAFGYPSYWRNRANRARLKHFTDALGPYAAMLNPTARDEAGDFVFEDFWERHGEATKAQLEKHGPGATWKTAQGEVLRIGENPIVRDPKKPDDTFYQLERFHRAEAQEQLHQLFWETYPEAAWLLNDFIEPGQEDARVQAPNGVEIPTFNRTSLWGLYGDTPAGFVEKLPGYTPDVAKTKALTAIAGAMISKALKLNWKSPGREYKSGEARVQNLVRPLIEGFNIRAAQAHAETLRRDTAEKLLKASMLPVPETGVPGDYARLDRDTFNPLVRALREANKQAQTEMPEIVAEARDQLRTRDLETIKMLFGDPALFNPNQMVHKQVLGELQRAFVRQRIDNEFWDWAMNWMRGSVAGILLDPYTIVQNKLSNYMFHGLRTMQRTGYAAAALASGDRIEAKRAIREAGYLVKGFFTNFFHPEIRARMDQLIAPEHFEPGNFLQLMQGPGADKSITDLLREANIGAAGLKAVGYASMDNHSKQKIALASLLSRASIAADEAGIKGAERKAWMHDWIKKAPVEARTEAMNAAKLFLMDYGNVPWWLDDGHAVVVSGHDITPGVNFLRAMAIPFWKYPYNYLKQIKRLSVSSGLTLISQTAERQTKNEAIGNLSALAMLYAAYWLTFTPWGGDDDDEIIGRDVDDEGNPLPFKYSTDSRVRLSKQSIAGRIAATALHMFGADTEGNEMWARLRTMPYATIATALGAAIRWMTNPKDVNRQLAVSGAWNILEDFMSVGSGARMGAAVLGYRDQRERNQALTTILARGGFDLATGRLIPPRMLSDIASFIDPVSRRLSKSKALGYAPGFLEGIESKVPGLTSQLPPSGKISSSMKPSNPKARAAARELQARGLGRGYTEYINAQGKLKAGFVEPESIYEKPPWQTFARWSGFNVKPVSAAGYREALSGGGEE